jgi:hypothetical protein
LCFDPPWYDVSALAQSSLRSDLDIGITVCSFPQSQQNIQYFAGSEVSISNYIAYKPLLRFTLI